MEKNVGHSTPSKPKMEQKQKQSPLGTYKIGGISVEFPYKPYGSQLAYMGKVIAALERAQRQGHCHALLESPTGTGKSLALLCATLAWQQQYSSKIASLPAQPPPSHPPPVQPPPPPPPSFSQAENALFIGGGFIPEQTQSGPTTAAGELLQATSGVDSGAERKSKVPTIFYASRTHSQITQVIREYRKTGYRVPMAVLASRKHYCTNKRVCSKKNVDEECKLLLKDTEQSCRQFKFAYKVKYHESLKKGGCNEVHDIEDLVKVGHMVKGCSYFAARDMALSARLVFCPYSYILNPIIRRAMEVDVKGDIVILDEAHNIEDMCREAGSLDVEEQVLDVLQSELSQLSLIGSVANIYQPLLDMVQGLIHWVQQKSNSLVRREFERYCSCWTGDNALRELQAAGIKHDCFPILEQCASQAIKDASDPEKDGVHLSGLSASTLEGLFSSLSYLFSQNGQGAFDYQLCLQKYVKRDEGMSVKGWTHSFNLWCLNPAVVFKEIAKASLSVILTSGTLSPLNSFSSELGVPFDICMEAPHVINMDSQVWAAAVATGPQCVPLNASYKTADGYEFQDALGAVLEEICKIVPDGTLIFFPSYKLMDKLCNRWKATGQWVRLNSQKTIFVEPRGNQDDFEPVLSGYYHAISGEKKGVVRKAKDAHKQVPRCGNSKEDCHHRLNGGAAFLAVCRGKVAETRFATHYIVLKRLVDVNQALKSMVISDILAVWRQSQTDRANNVRTLILDEDWWAQIDYLLSFIEPIYTLIRRCDTDKPILGDIYDCIDTMVEKVRDIIIAKEQDPSEFFYKQIYEVIKKRWDKMTTPLQLLAYALNPKYYHADMLALPNRTAPNKDVEVVEGYKQVFKKMFTDPRIAAEIRDEFGTFASSDGTYANVDAMADKKEMDSIKWWNFHGALTTHLQKLAIKLLSQVSEGIDFADENARAVVVVGIPFPNKNDIQVVLKKKYNDTNKSSKNLLSGDQWYCQQAFRTLNQAVGRCIRHRLDFGAIILLDERFKKPRNLEYMSKWLRNSIRQFDNFGESLDGLRDFFSTYEDRKPEILTDNNLISKNFPVDDSDLLICKENSSVPNAKASTEEVTKKETHKIYDFFSSRQSNKDNSVTKKVKSVRDSVKKTKCPGDANLNTNASMMTNLVIQLEDDFTDDEDHVDSNQISQRHSKYFKQSSLQEIIPIESSLQETVGIETPLKKTIDIESCIKIEDLSTKNNLSSTRFLSLNEAESLQVGQIETPRQAATATDSSQFSLASPCLVNGCTAFVCGERLNASAGTGSDGEFVSNHLSSTSVGMSGSNTCRKRRSPIRCQLDCERKTLLFGQLTESNNLYQKDQADCRMSPQNKVISCKKIGNLCPGRNSLSPLDNQCESTLFSSSTARSNVVDSLDCADNRDRVLVQTESIESSDLLTRMPVQDSSLCSSADHKYNIAAVPSKDIAEKTYSISCNVCGRFFGLPEKQFHVRCTVASLSKSYISGLTNGQQDRQSNVDTSQAIPARTPVIISDIACLNPLFTRSGSEQSSLTSSSAHNKRESVWVEQDGCVFRALFCPQCEASQISVGVHVVATDVSNMSLLDKVIFIKDHVKIVDAEPSISKEVLELQNNINVSNSLDVSSIEDYSFNSNSKRTRQFSIARTKLKLPKKD